ncbi:BMP family ABC transporter substrate-binding protein [[Mycoplasma] cavipharyngis]|uniref:BMP family ABC transporter substrate-binding protein n=1 Tax=[Mycoplasma] cavipharyngis TaxID=92757 RepID=UPI003703DA81
MIIPKNIILKRFFQSLVLGIISPIVLAACANSQRYINTDVANIKTYADSQNQIFEQAKKDKKIKNSPITLITDSGIVTDNSFNQSLWEAISRVSVQAGINNSGYQETTKSNDLPQQYNLALNDKKIWVLSGFGQQEKFKEWLKVPANKKSFVEKKIVVLAIDWDFKDNNTEFMPQGQGISLNYKTEQSAFIVGYATAAYLAAKYHNEETKRVVSGFGGGNFYGVTSFLSGWLAGIGYWNHNNTDINDPAFTNAKNKKVKFNQDTIILDTGFSETTAVKQKVTALVKEKTPQVVLPVAGTLTGTTLNAIRDSQTVIGVDSNQALAFPAFKNKFFTSIEKRVGLTAYRVLSALLRDDLDSEFLKQDASNKFVLTGATNAANLHLFKGFNDRFVDYSPSQLANANDRTLAEKALELGKKVFEEKTKNNSSSNSTTNIEPAGVMISKEHPALKIPDMSDPSKNQEYLDKYIKEYINNTTTTKSNK